MQVVDDAGELAAVLAGDADRGDLHLVVAVLCVNPGLGLPHRLAPQPLGREDLDVVVVDHEIDRVLGLALDDEEVVAGEFELGAPLAARVRRRDRAGQRALGDHRVAPARGRHGAGQRTGSENQLVLRREGIDLRIDLFAEIFGAQTAAADVFVRPLPVEGLNRRFPLGQIDAQNPVLHSHDGLSSPIAFAVALPVTPAADGSPSARARPARSLRSFYTEAAGTGTAFQNRAVGGEPFRDRGGPASGWSACRPWSSRADRNIRAASREAG